MKGKNKLNLELGLYEIIIRSKKGRVRSMFNYHWQLEEGLIFSLSLDNLGTPFENVIIQMLS